MHFLLRLLLLLWFNNAPTAVHFEVFFFFFYKFLVKRGIPQRRSSWIIIRLLNLTTGFNGILISGVEKVIKEFPQLSERNN